MAAQLPIDKSLKITLQNVKNKSSEHSLKYIPKYIPVVYK